MLIVPSSNIFPFSTNSAAAAGTEYIIKTNQEIYVPGDSLIVYGKSVTNDVLVIRIFDPSLRAIRLDNVQTDKDGYFKQTVFKWPEPTKNLPFGTYTIEILSSIRPKNSVKLEIAFSGEVQHGLTDEGSPTVLTFPVPHTLGVKLDSPNEIGTNKQFRIFIQVTFDDALVDSDDSASLLGTSHIHSGNETISIPEFKKLHEGLYYADVILPQDGTYIIHAIAFYKGYLSHDSRVITASISTIGTIQDTLNQLGGRLNSTNKQINSLQGQLDHTGASLNSSQVAITKSVEDARSTIKGDIQDLEQASGQINSIFLPILALISVIIALQISLFARIRSSYR